MIIVTPRLEFDEAEHAYRLDGELIPSVTEILGDAGMIDTMWYTDEARDRGKAVHKAIELISEGTLDEETVHPVLYGYLEAYTRYGQLAAFDGEVGAELVMADRTLGYAGTLDWLVIRDGRLELIDFKTGAWQRWHDAQLAAYRNLVLANAAHLPFQGLPVGSWRVVQLKPDGKPVVHKARGGRESNHFTAFCSALQVYRYKRREL